MKLHYIRTADSEIVCDEEGRPLEDVVDIDCSSPLGEAAVLTIRVRLPRPRWDEALGTRVVNAVPPVDLRTAADFP